MILTIKKYLPASLKNRIRFLTNKIYREDLKESTRIDTLPRYTAADTYLLGKKIRILDNASFRFIEKEIFDQQIYRFHAGNDQPYIIDCGANIGLSIIYFKQLYPAARITAFEPDKSIYDVLELNVASFGLKNVALINKACWNAETTLEFFSEGADGGRKAMQDDKANNIVQVPATRLKDHLQQKTDFLKIDIEGAETVVLKDIVDELKNVEKLFVEYHSFLGQEQTLDEIIAVIKNAGFRMHISSPGVHSKSPFEHIDTYAGMDNQLNIYAWRQGLNG